MAFLLFMSFFFIQKEHVLDENGVHDWSKMDKIVAGMAKTFNPIPSMFGTFDFDDQPETSQAAEKQRRTRRKADPTTEKRPTSVDQAENPDGRTSKVEHVFNQIQEVNIQSFFFRIFLLKFAFLVYHWSNSSSYSMD